MKTIDNINIYNKFAKVKVGDGAAMMIVIDPISEPHLERTQRYGSLGELEKNRMIVASILSSYDYLLSDEITQTESIRRLKLMREARKKIVKHQREGEK